MRGGFLVMMFGVFRSDLSESMACRVGNFPREGDATLAGQMTGRAKPAHGS
jgi:hypothetical protein